jgi:hypothetical protein
MRTLLTVPDKFADYNRLYLLLFIGSQPYGTLSAGY